MLLTFMHVEDAFIWGVHFRFMLMNWTLDLGVASIMPHCLRYMNENDMIWYDMIYDMDGRTVSPLTQSHMDNLLCFIYVFLPFSAMERFMCGVNLLNVSCSQKNSSEIYFHLFKFSPIPPNVHFHFWVNYTFKNTGVSEKLERGNPQQINRTGREHSLGQTHIYPVS